MKGGRTAPRSKAILEAYDNPYYASMKGGRTAPRSMTAAAIPTASSGFNEGGADCPPKLISSMSSSWAASKLQ